MAVAAEVVTTAREITVRATEVVDMVAEEFDKDLIVVSFSKQRTASFVWKTIPSEARVTRDEVSGLQ